MFEDPIGAKGIAGKIWFRLGSGVLGRTAPVVGIALVGVAAIAVSLGNLWVSVAGLVLIGLGGWYFLHKAFKYAYDFPNHALMDGGSLVRALEIEQSAKDKNLIIVGESTSTANVNAPQVTYQEDQGE